MSSTPEDFGGLETAPQPQQDAEKARDRAAKAQARAQRLTKDERKSRKHDVTLALLISSLVGDVSRSKILDAVLDALEVDIPSHFLMGAVSLSDEELSKMIRLSAGKLVSVISVERQPEPIDFNEHQIDAQLQLRMNVWFDDLLTFLFSESSIVATQKFLDLVSSQNRESVMAGDTLEYSPKTQPEKVRLCAQNILSETFTWFLSTLNIRVAPQSARSYSNFILDEIIRRARVFLENADQELLSRGNIDLFGI